MDENNICRINRNFIKPTCISHTTVIAILTATGIFVKQFYLRSSGLMQIGDVLLVFAMAVSLCVNGAKIRRIDISFFLFAVIACFINIMYSIEYHHFFLSTLHMLFNLLMVLFLFRPMMENNRFLDYIQLACRLSILSQLIIYFLGMGRWFQGTRYMGTLNDPNQFAFYITSMLFIEYLIDVIRGRRIRWIWIIFAAFGVVISASTGMLMELSIFLLCLMLFGGNSQGVGVKRVVVLLVILGIFLFIIVFWKDIIVLMHETGVFAFDRVSERLLNSDGNLGQLARQWLRDRQLQRILIRPDFFLYGCGEGLWERFIPISGEGYELHATVISLPYCYGIVPCTCLLFWLIKNILGCKRSMLGVYIALFVEAFTLVNHRQSMFWFIILLASHQYAKTHTGVLSRESVGMTEK